MLINAKNIAQRLTLFGVIVALLVVGVYFIAASHAATSYLTNEAEAGSLSGAAEVVSDSSASNASYVQFGNSLNAQYGFFSDIEYDTNTQMMTTLASYKAAGAQYVRFQLEWSMIQPNNASTYDWSQIDMLVNDILAENMTPLPVAGDTPTWADPSPSDCTSSPTCAPAPQYETDFGTFMKTAAARYDGKITDWEIWNEANNPNFWQPAPDPVEYTALLEAAYSGIHQSEPNATVLSSGLAPGTDTEGNGWISPVTFLSDIYADGGKGSFDAVGWHPYTWPVDPDTQDSGLAWYQMVHNARSIMANNGDSGLDIWATEFGAPTCTGSISCETEAQQASSIQSAITLWKSYSWSGPLIIYSYQDSCNDETNPECYFGVTRADGSAKPVLSMLEKNYSVE